MVLLASCGLSPNLLFADNVEPAYQVNGRGEVLVCRRAREDENAQSWCASIECSWPRLVVRTLQGLADVGGRGGASFWLAECLFGARGGTEMIGARVRVVNGDGSFTIVVCAESLREIEQTARARYPGSAVKIAFPIEPECFFASGPLSALAPVSRQWKD